MIHDSLCPLPKPGALASCVLRGCKANDELCDRTCPACQCNLIDQVRQDVTSAAVQRVERISKEDGVYCYVLHYCDVIDAINGWQPIEDKITFIRGNDRLKKLREKKS